MKCVCFITIYYSFYYSLYHELQLNSGCLCLIAVAGLFAIPAAVLETFVCCEPGV